MQKQESTNSTNHSHGIISSVNRFGDGALLFGIAFFACTLPLSNFCLSLAQFFMAGGWLLGGNPLKRFQRALQQPALWIFWGLYIWLFIGLWNTSDMAFAMSDMRIKAPLLLMPLFLSTTTITVTQYRYILSLFVAGVFASTAVGFYRYMGWGGIHYADVRDIVLIDNHIRLALMICVSVVICSFYSFQKETPVVLQLTLSALSLWLIYFLVILESFTGLGILVVLGILILASIAVSKKQIWSVRLLGFLLLAAVVVSTAALMKYLFYDSIQPVQVDVSSLKKTTRLGHPYEHIVSQDKVENGHVMGLYVCNGEMDSTWQSRTGQEPNNTPVGNYSVHDLLHRFLNSKGLTKDADGVNALSDDEVKAIQQGCASVNNLHSGVINRLRLLAWEYRQYYFTHDPNGHSFPMRVEFWKTGWWIFKQHPITGVGTGDIHEEYAAAYVKMHSKLNEDLRYVGHNEYLRIAVLFGIPGLCYFLFALFYPAIKPGFNPRSIYFGFWIILMCSMLTEDTIETQIGASFYAFLNAFLFFAAPKTQAEESPVSESMG